MAAQEVVSGRRSTVGPSMALLTPRQKLALKAAQNTLPAVPQILTCGICGGPIFSSFKSPHPLSFSIDHIWPKARGGLNILGNLQPAHRGCNSAKRDRLPTRPEAENALLRATRPTLGQPRRVTAPVPRRVRAIAPRRPPGRGRLPTILRWP